MSIPLAVQQEIKAKAPALHAQRSLVRYFHHRAPLIGCYGLGGFIYHNGMFISEGVPRADCHIPRGAGFGRLTFRVRTTDASFDARLVKSAMDGASFTKDRMTSPSVHRFFNRSSPSASMCAVIALRKGYYEIHMDGVPVASLKEWARTLDALGKRLILHKEMRQFRDFKTREIIRCLPQL